jgi:hypothetical protein
MTVHVVSLGFVPARIWRESLKRFQQTTVLKDIKHHFLLQHYPLNKAQNSAELREIAKDNGLIWHDAGKNLGLHDGFNFVTEQFGLKPEDVVIAYDPDSNPVSTGWDEALVTVLSEPRYVWASLMLPAARKSLAGQARAVPNAVKGVRVLEIAQPVINSISAFNGSWLLDCGGLTEPNKFYGGLECQMWPKLKDKKWVFLPDYTENHDLLHTQDPEYRQYKWEHAHERTWAGDFESWLKKN